ncbi:MAG: N-6 DNA methylase [Gemmataceae bacterium]|nr:N-6 DNA methylase [Gemmataceae bacterium]
MPAPAEILELVERFDRNADAYRSPQYNEAQTRQEFINPFFKYLGWDIDNTQGYAEAYKDVIHEASVKIGGATKAPDYCFRIGGVRKFFLEAKKPYVNIKDDPAPAYQLRRYAWSAKLPLSILTNFEEFAVYDCRIKPAQTDKASAARTLYLSYTEYADRWDDIAGIFSREAILKGSFDRYAETARVKKGTATVDAAFLQEIEAWRELLARNLALRNSQLSQRELNYAVQVTIDRIIFLRMCEDRGIERYGQLLALRNGPAVYGRLKQLFQDADDRYNSGLFYFRKEKDRSEPPDELTPSLNIDDRPLQEIIRGLYYPESPYEFSVLPAEILGQVYEQFLGKVIRLTAGHQARVEDKPEVKKAGGVYYTPAYIVEYIVKHTVGKLLEGKTPRQAARLRVLDPACGSGSFLLGAYQHLLDWHRDWYVNDGPNKHTKELYQAPGGGWRLTTAEKKRILLDSIYGVDIDPQAVEVTKLSLLLKVLEGESQQTLDQELRLFHERALPDLASNIKCGNSLIGPDFYEGQQLALFDEEERYRINVFDWNEAFPWLEEVGGFDAVVGNPPYVRQESLRTSKAYLKRRYKSFEGTADLYVYFVERAISLLRDGGYFSFIVSSSFLRTNFGRPLRAFIRNSAALRELVDFGGLPVFEGAKDTYVCIPLIAKQAQPDHVSVSKVKSLDGLDLPSYVATTSHSVPGSRFSLEGWTTALEEVSLVFDKLKARSAPLGEYVQHRIFRGILTGLNEAFEIDSDTRQRLIDYGPACEPLIRPFLGGQDIRRYHVRPCERYLIAIPCGWTAQTMEDARKHVAKVSEREAWDWLSEHHGPIARHLAPFAGAAKARQDQGEFWWELRPCDYYPVLNGPKIVYPDITKHPRFYLDTEGIYIRNTAYCLGTADPYLLGLLNSRLSWFAIGQISIPFGTRAGEFRYRLFTQYAEQIPIRSIDLTSKHDKARYDLMVDLVEQMLALHKQLAAAKAPHDKTVLQAQIRATDRQIDRLVYELYGLTEDEIQIVEQATGPG